METLYSLTSDYMSLMELADSTDPEDAQAFADTLEGIIGAVDLKMDDYAVCVDHMNTRAAAIDKEITRLTARRDSIKNSVKRMKERLKESMIATDRRKVVTDFHTFRIQKNGGVVALIIDDPTRVPDKFCKVIVEPDNDKIRKALETGDEEAKEFAHLAERGEHLVIS